MKHILLLSIFFFSQSLYATQKLVLIGGGTRPVAALERFASWAGSQQSNILIVTWATENPLETFKSIRADLTSFSNAIVHAYKPENNSTKKDFLKQLNDATGVFFSGGYH